MLSYDLIYKDLQLHFQMSTVTSLELELMLDTDKVCIREEPQLHNLRSQGIRSWLRNALML